MGEVKKQKKFRGFFTRNNVIVLLNLLTACALLFCVFFFFFSNLRMFLKDITSYMAFSPVILLLGILFVCFYIMALVFYLFEAKTVWLADRFDLAYKIVFSVTLVMLIVRLFMGDFMCVDGYYCGVYGDPCHSPRTGIEHELIPIVVIAILSGLVNWFIPKIKDNDNTEF